MMAARTFTFLGTGYREGKEGVEMQVHEAKKEKKKKKSRETQTVLQQKETTYLGTYG
jgi:hypothetical protein